MQHIYGFHALRAFSVILVILSHVGIMKAVHHPVWVKFFSVFNASYGVKTFFVLSGFLITTLLIKEHQATGRVSIVNFVARRALRILPLYFLILALAAILILTGIAQPAWTAMLYSVLYIYNFRPNADAVNYLNHLWSLAVEEQFYILWPLFFAAFCRSRFTLVSIAFAVIALCWWRMVGGYGDFGKSHVPLWWTVPAIYPIMIGCLAALAVKRGEALLRSNYALAASAALIISPLAIPMSATWEIVSTLGIAGVTAWIYLNQHVSAVRRLDWGPVGYLGVISYGLYMWQGFLTGNGSYRFPGFDWPLHHLLGAALTFPAAALSFHYFESPLSSLRSRFRSANKSVSRLSTA